MYEKSVIFQTAYEQLKDELRMRHEELDEAIETDNNLIKAIEKDDDQEQVDNGPKVKRSLQSIDVKLEIRI